jgi:nicotinamidase-related amidase
MRDDVIAAAYDLLPTMRPERTHEIVTRMGTALLVIDVQNEYVSGGLPIIYPPVEGSLARIRDAIDAANKAGVPVILIRHTESDAEGGLFVRDSLAWQLHESVSSREHIAVVDKTLPGSFTGTNLEALLRERGVDEVVIVGYMTHMCVDTTARQANHLSIDVQVLGDATGTIDLSEVLPAELVHRVELGVLDDGFASVTTTDSWIATLR